jgi:hypothetical protein
MQGAIEVLRRLNGVRDPKGTVLINVRDRENLDRLAPKKSGSSSQTPIYGRAISRHGSSMEGVNRLDETSIL